jgi:hypothetical protein
LCAENLSFGSVMKKKISIRTCFLYNVLELPMVADEHPFLPFRQIAARFVPRSQLQMHD